MNPKTIQGFDPETCRSLYVGNLALQITEPLLYEIFAALGNVESVKVIKDKTTGASLGYGFVDYCSHQDAYKALNQLNGCNVYGAEIKVNWAFAGSGTKEDTSNHHHVFVGDLSPEIEDRALHEAFSAFGSLSDARVMWDQNTGRSRGYGFVAFRDREDAEQAISDMNGVWLGTRAIRVNWANQKSIPKLPTKQSSLEYETVVVQSSPTNTTVYVGNIGPELTEKELRGLFSQFGFLEEVRIQADKGYAFVRYQTHDTAATAIVHCHGTMLGSKSIRCSWGKERYPPSSGQSAPITVQQPTQSNNQQFSYGMSYGYAPPPYQTMQPTTFMPMGMNPNTNASQITYMSPFPNSQQQYMPFGYNSSHNYGYQ